MKILALGDSFTKGSELQDPSNSSWPIALGKLTNAVVDNHAEYGGSNDMMFRKAVELTAQQSYDLVIVAWTESHRMEVYLNEPIYMERRQYTPGPLSVNHHWGELTWTKEYYTNHSNEEYFLRKWLCQVVALQGYFENCNQRYIFLNAFGNQHALPKYDLVLKEQVNTERFVGWPDSGIVEWVYGTPHGKYGHPLEQGHQIVAEKIYEHIRNFGWVS